MYKQKTWKRVAVLFAGPGMNFVIGLVLIYAIAVIWGLPNLHPSTAAIVGKPPVPHRKYARPSSTSAPVDGPAALPESEPGDVVVKVGDTDGDQLRPTWPPRCASCTAPFRSSSSATARRCTTYVDVTQHPALA